MRSMTLQLIKIPNLLSLLRILLIPFFIAAYLSNNNPLLAPLLLVASGITDMLDGMIARRFHMITDLGKILDPVADKLTQLAILSCLALHYPLFISLLCVFLTKELLTLVGGLLLYHRRIHPGSAKWFGKLATCFFYLSSIVIVMFPAMKLTYVNGLIWVNIALLVFAFIRYIPVFFLLKKTEPL